MDEVAGSHHVRHKLQCQQDYRVHPILPHVWARTPHPAAHHSWITTARGDRATGLHEDTYVGNEQIFIESKR